MQQRTEEWFQARLGKVSASQVWRVLAKLKNGKPSAERQGYMIELLAEKITGKKTEIFISSSMQWGIDNEENAKKAYTEQTGRSVEECGFFQRYKLDAGASPDGLIGKTGLIEIKCPNTTTHLNTILTGEINSKYYAQMQMQMWATKKRFCDFVSFDPRCRIGSLFIKRVRRDKDFISNMNKEIRLFIQEIKNLEKNINKHEKTNKITKRRIQKMAKLKNPPTEMKQWLENNKHVAKIVSELKPNIKPQNTQKTKINDDLSSSFGTQPKPRTRSLAEIQKAADQQIAKTAKLDTPEFRKYLEVERKKTIAEHPIYSHHRNMMKQEDLLNLGGCE